MGAIRHVLVVDDEPEVRLVLRQGLEADGFAVAEAEDRAGVFRALDANPTELITLDIGLGGDDGLALAREIRAVRNLPIVMITGRGEPIDRVVGLEHGADDYIAKPFHIREVSIRVRAVLTRYGARPYWVGNLAVRFGADSKVLDPIRMTVSAPGGQAVDLTETEFRLLELLVHHPGRVLSRDDMWRMLRGHDWSPLDRSIDVHIARLRRKIEPPGEAPTLIKSVRGVGYVFASEVRPA